MTKNESKAKPKSELDAEREEARRVREENEVGLVSPQRQRDEKADTVAGPDEMAKLQAKDGPTVNQPNRNTDLTPRQRRDAERDERQAKRDKRMREGTTDARPHGRKSQAIIEPPKDAKPEVRHGHMVTHGQDILSAPRPMGEDGLLTPREQKVEDRKAEHAKAKEKVLREREEILRKQGALG